jgi:hypothetical protein
MVSSCPYVTSLIFFKNESIFMNVSLEVTPSVHFNLFPPKIKKIVTMPPYEVGAVLT